MLTADATTVARPVRSRPEFLLLALLAACQRAPLGAAGRPDASVATASSASPTVAPAAPVAPARVPDGPLWRDAGADPDDTLRLARLAESEGASGLLDTLGGPAEALALRALPFAADADLAAAPLAARLRTAPAAALPALVESIDAIASRPRTQTDPLAPVGWRGCHEALAAIARRPDLPAGLRAAAVTAARRLEERFPPPRASLPGDFDR